MKYHPILQLCQGEKECLMEGVEILCALPRVLSGFLICPIIGAWLPHLGAVNSLRFRSVVGLQRAETGQNSMPINIHRLYTPKYLTGTCEKQTFSTTLQSLLCDTKEGESCVVVSAKAVALNVGHHGAP